MNIVNIGIVGLFLIFRYHVSSFGHGWRCFEGFELPVGDFCSIWINECLVKAS